MSGEKRSRFWGSVKLFMLVFGGLFVLTLLGSVLWRNFSGADGMSQQLESMRPYFAIWRWGLMIAFVASWKPIVQRFMGHWPDEEREKLVHLRWRIAVWLILIELVVIQGLLGDALNVLISAVTGSGS